MSTLTAPPVEPVFAAFAAIDWASKEHVVASVPAAGGRIEISKLKNTPEAVELWAASLRQRFPGAPAAVAVEQKRGAVIYMLSKYDHLVLYPRRAEFHRSLRPDSTRDPGLLWWLWRKPTMGESGLAPIAAPASLIPLVPK